jgi:hypothetical protein
MCIFSSIFFFVCLVYFVYLVWMLIKHYNFYTILNLIGKSSKHLCKNPEVIYHSITMMFVSFRSSTTGATSRGGTGASTFTFVFLLLFPLLGRGVSCCSIFTVTYYFVLIKKFTVVRGSCFINVICIIYTYLCPPRFQYHMKAGGLAF